VEEGNCGLGPLFVPVVPISARNGMPNKPAVSLSILIFIYIWPFLLLPMAPSLTFAKFRFRPQILSQFIHFPLFFFVMKDFSAQF
jgi:hypothetical protein